MSNSTNNYKAGVPPIFKIIFAFEASLPASSLITLRTFKRKLERAGVRAPVTSAPIEMLPADADLVLAPTELVERIRERVQEVIPVDDIADDVFLDQLVKRLRAAQEIQDQARNSEKPIIVTYRGDERLG